MLDVVVPNPCWMLCKHIAVWYSERYPHTLASSWPHIRMKDSCVPFPHGFMVLWRKLNVQRDKEHADTQHVLRSGQPGNQDWDEATSISLPAAWDVCMPWWKHWGVKCIKCMYGATAAIPVRPDWSWKEKPSAENPSGLYEVTQLTQLHRKENCPQASEDQVCHLPHWTFLYTLHVHCLFNCLFKNLLSVMSLLI